MFKKGLTVFLLTLTLLGVQIVQASPLHDHLSHVSGCTLCHADSNDHALTPDDNLSPDFEPASASSVTTQQSLNCNTRFSFQSRAPPSLSI